MKSLFLVCALVVAGCGSSSSGSPDLATSGGGGGNDLAMSSSSGDMAMAGQSGDGGNHALCCNDPANTGNEKGVGKYCNDSGQCSGTSAVFCATIGDPTEHFCTMPCTMGSTTTCGTGASCQCQNNQCGCVPDVCVTPPPGC